MLCNDLIKLLFFEVIEKFYDDGPWYLSVNGPPVIISRLSLGRVLRISLTWTCYLWFIIQTLDKYEDRLPSSDCVKPAAVLIFKDIDYHQYLLLDSPLYHEVWRSRCFIAFTSRYGCVWRDNTRIA